MQTQSASLMAAAWPAEGQARWIRNAVLVLAGTALIAICAKIQVPMWPVPMTMQTWAVLLIGAAYGWRLGGVTVIAYLLEGIVGLPVFAGAAAGPAYMAGPTAGYLVGFVLSAMLVGWLAERGWDRNVITTALAMLAGNVLLYIPGLLWLGVLFGWDKPILEWGLTPFILGDLAKLGLAAAVLPVTWKLVGRRRA